MRFVKLEDNIVVSIRYGSIILEGEIQSDYGEIGQQMLEDGTFVDPPTDTITEQPTLEDKVNYLYYKSLGVI